MLLEIMAGCHGVMTWSILLPVVAGHDGQGFARKSHGVAIRSRFS